MHKQEIFFIETLGSLYTDVQLQEVFPDSKYFVDCTPVSDPADIVKAYDKEKGLPGFNIKKFIAAHFILPAELMNEYHSADKPIVQHLNDLWNVLTREPSSAAGTLISLPFSYIVPGGRFREVYYWDSYFTMLGLQVCNRTDLIENMVANFAFLIEEFGFIPNGNRTYYLGRSQPSFFSLMVTLLAEQKGEEVLLKYRRQLEKEYAFWMDGEQNLSATENAFRRCVLMTDGNTLNRYWDDNDTARPEACIEDTHLAKKAAGNAKEVYRHIRAAAESGWDFSSRWFRDGINMATIETTHLIPVDLNCLMLYAEQTLLHIYKIAKEDWLINLFNQKINNRKNAIQRFCWNEANGFYFDYNFIDKTQSKLFTLAAVYPLFFLLANQNQAERIASLLEEKFLQQGGLLTTIYDTGQQWDAPNGWAPLQWMAYKGLKNYQQDNIAAKIKDRWMALNEKVYAATGKMMEKYDVADTTSKAGGGEYPNQDGFGWTNGVYLKFRQDK